MIQLIAGIIFLVSVAGIAFLVVKKMPQVAQVSERGTMTFKKGGWVVNLEKKVKDAYVHFFEKQIPLHKFLSFLKVLILKTERRVDHWLHGIRKKSQHRAKGKQGSLK